MQLLSLSLSLSCSLTIVLALVGLVQCQSIDPGRAEKFFHEGHALHSRANSHADAAAFEEAIINYKQALDSMGGQHAATQYYLGTCQLDSGKFEEGVKNVAAALKAEPDTFGPEAFQRLTAGQQSVDMICREASEQPPSSADDRLVRQEPRALVTAWDDVFDRGFLPTLTAAATALQREQHKENAPRTLWFPAEDILKVGRKFEEPNERVQAMKEHPLHVAVYHLYKLLSQTEDSKPGDSWRGCELWVRRQVLGAGVTTHFDLDIGSKRRQKIERAPWRSSITYLPSVSSKDSQQFAAGAASFLPGPTFVLDQVHPSSEPPSVADFVWPRAGRFAVFDGKLAHGVLPCDEKRIRQAELDPNSIRFTMLVNWWTEVPAAPECSLVSSSVQEVLRRAVADVELKEGALSSSMLLVRREGEEEGGVEEAMRCESKLGGVLKSAAAVPCPESPPPATSSGLQRVYFS